MTRARAVILGAIAVCVAIVVVVLLSGGDDGPRSFTAAESTGVLLVELTRVGDEVSGSLTPARLMAPTPVLFGNDALLREMQQGSSPFTGTVSGDSVRLQRAGSALGTGVNRQLDSDALKLIFTLDSGGGPATVGFDPASREDFQAVARLRAADAARSRQSHRCPSVGGCEHRGGDHAHRDRLRESTPPARSRRPVPISVRSGEGGGRHRAAARSACGGWTTLVRFFLRSAATPGARPRRGERPQTGRAVPSGSGGNLAYGAELRFAAMPNDPIRIVHEGGQWRIARYR